MTHRSLLMTHDSLLVTRYSLLLHPCLCESSLLFGRLCSTVSGFVQVRHRRPRADWRRDAGRRQRQTRSFVREPPDGVEDRPTRLVQRPAHPLGQCTLEIVDARIGVQPAIGQRRRVERQRCLHPRLASVYPTIFRLPSASCRVAYCESGGRPPRSGTRRRSRGRIPEEGAGVATRPPTPGARPRLSAPGGSGRRSRRQSPHASPRRPATPGRTADARAHRSRAATPAWQPGFIVAHSQGHIDRQPPSH